MVWINLILFWLIPQKNKIMFLFESNDRNLYNSPDAYVLSNKNNVVEWGTVLTIHPVFYKGGSVLVGTQQISANFTHEGKLGNLGTVNWLKCGSNQGKFWYGMDNVKVLNVEQVIRFDLGQDHPKYFMSRDDLLWYIGYIYNLDKIYVNDETSF